MGLFHIPILFFHSRVRLYPVLDLDKNIDELSGSGVAMAWCPAPLQSRWTEKVYTCYSNWGGGMAGDL